MYDGNNGNSNVNEHYQPPTYNAPQYPYPPAPQQRWQPMPQYYAPPMPPYSGFAITSFVLGLASFVLYIVLVPPILAIVFGILSLRDHSKRPYLRGKWMAVTGLVLGSIMLVVGILVWVYIITSGADPSTYNV